MYKRTVNTEIPGPNSRHIFRNSAIHSFLCGKPDNETHADIVFKKGHGSFLMDVDSNCFVDCASTLNLPFGHEQLLIQECAVVNSSNYMTPQRLSLVSELKAIFPYLSGFQFRSSGTESVEAALRYIHACFPNGVTLFSFEGCYHGLTLAAQQIMGKSKANQVVILPFPSSDNASEFLQYLEQGLDSGPIALAFESIQGNAVRSLPLNVFELLWELKERHFNDVLLFCDDMLASIRCGNWSSLPEYIKPDLLVGGKSWSGGFPFSFFAINKLVRDRAGDILGTTTYGGNPVACHAAYTTIRRISSENIFEHIIECEKRINENGITLWRESQGVVSAECHGLLFGIQMETTIDAKKKGQALLAKGVLCSQIDNVLRFSPALNIQSGLLGEVCDVISSILNN
ncbi:MAG: aminotransferase class III-fold pyridoxal phosphate-dependent enzyme [Chlorobium sp.]